MINHLNQDKSQCEHNVMILNDISKKNENDKKSLCNKLDSLKLRSKS